MFFLTRVELINFFSLLSLLCSSVYHLKIFILIYTYLYGKELLHICAAFTNFYLIALWLPANWYENLARPSAVIEIQSDINYGVLDWSMEDYMESVSFFCLFIYENFIIFAWHFRSLFNQNLRKFVDLKRTLNHRTCIFSRN